VPDPPITRTTRTYSYTQSHCIIIKKALIDLFVFDSRKMKVRQNKRKQSMMMKSVKYRQVLVIVYFTYFIEWRRVNETENRKKGEMKVVKQMCIIDHAQKNVNGWADEEDTTLSVFC
jgi:hypothetical protein